MLPPAMQNRLDDIIDENENIIFQPLPKENIPNIPTEGFHIDDDFTSLTNPATKIDIGKPQFDGDNTTTTPKMIRLKLKNLCYKRQLT